MKFRYIILSIFIFSVVIEANAQKKDSLNKTLLIKSILPAVLISSGIIINNSQFEQNLQTNLPNKVGNTYEFRIDNYTKAIKSIYALHLVLYICFLQKSN